MISNTTLNTNVSEFVPCYAAPSIAVNDCTAAELIRTSTLNADVPEFLPRNYYVQSNTEVTDVTPQEVFAEEAHESNSSEDINASPPTKMAPSQQSVDDGSLAKHSISAPNNNIISSTIISNSSDTDLTNASSSTVPQPVIGFSYADAVAAVVAAPPEDRTAEPLSPPSQKFVKKPTEMKTRRTGTTKPSPAKRSSRNKPQQKIVKIADPINQVAPEKNHSVPTYAQMVGPVVVPPVVVAVPVVKSVSEPATKKETIIIDEPELDAATLQAIALSMAPTPPKWQTITSTKGKKKTLVVEVASDFWDEHASSEAPNPNPNAVLPKDSIVSSVVNAVVEEEVVRKTTDVVKPKKTKAKKNAKRTKVESSEVIKPVETIPSTAEASSTPTSDSVDDLLKEFSDDIDLSLIDFEAVPSIFVNAITTSAIYTEPSIEKSRNPPGFTMNGSMGFGGNGGGKFDFIGNRRMLREEEEMVMRVMRSLSVLEQEVVVNESANEAAVEKEQEIVSNILVVNAAEQELITKEETGEQKIAAEDKQDMEKVCPALADKVVEEMKEIKEIDNKVVTIENNSPLECFPIEDVILCHAQQVPREDIVVEIKPTETLKFVSIADENIKMELVSKASEAKPEAINCHPISIESKMETDDLHQVNITELSSSTQLLSKATEECDPIDFLVKRSTMSNQNQKASDTAVHVIDAIQADASMLKVVVERSDAFQTIEKINGGIESNSIRFSNEKTPQLTDEKTDVVDAAAAAATLVNFEPSDNEMVSDLSSAYDDEDDDDDDDNTVITQLNEYIEDVMVDSAVIDDDDMILDTVTDGEIEDLIKQAEHIVRLSGTAASDWMMAANRTDDDDDVYKDRIESPRSSEDSGILDNHDDAATSSESDSGERADRRSAVGQHQGGSITQAVCRWLVQKQKEDSPEPILRLPGDPILSDKIEKSIQRIQISEMFKSYAADNDFDDDDDDDEDNENEPDDGDEEESVSSNSSEVDQSKNVKSNPLHVLSVSRKSATNRQLHRNRVATTTTTNESDSKLVVLGEPDILEYWENDPMLQQLLNNTDKKIIRSSKNNNNSNIKKNVVNERQRKSEKTPGRRNYLKTPEICCIM